MSARPPDAFRLTVSVVVCAHTMDRWDDIVAGVDALARQTVPPLETILVVDDNPELLGARLATRSPTSASSRTPRTGGASGARNTGIAQAKGTIIAFLDDDARPEPDWMEQLLAPYDDPAVMAVGGVAPPVWPERRPDHLAPELDWVVGCTYQGQPTGARTCATCWAATCRCGGRRSTRSAASTRTIGRIGLIPLGCEETELCIRLGQRSPGRRVVFEPRAVVHHRVTAARTTWPYLRSRSYAEGVSRRRSARLVGAADATSVETRLRDAGADRRAAPGARAAVSAGTRPAGAARPGSSRRPLADRLRLPARAAGPPGPGRTPGPSGDRGREDPPAGAVLPAGDRRRGAARPQPVGRAGLRGGTRCTSPAWTSASRPSSTPA